MSFAFRPAIIALVGVALLLNPYYLFPDGGGHAAITHQVERVDDDAAAEAALLASERVLHCPGERPCALEREVLDAGAVEYELNRSVGDRRPYDVVWMDGRTYRPEETTEDGTMTLELDEIDRTSAVELAAVPAAERSDAVRAAVDTGSVTVYGDRVPAFERNEIVERDGEYYYHEGVERRGVHWAGGLWLAALRGILTVGGIGALLWAGVTFGAHSRASGMESGD